MRRDVARFNAFADRLADVEASVDNLAMELRRLSLDSRARGRRPDAESFADLAARWEQVRADFDQLRGQLGAGKVGDVGT